MFCNQRVKERVCPQNMYSHRQQFGVTFCCVGISILVSGLMDLNLNCLSLIALVQLLYNVLKIEFQFTNHYITILSAVVL